MKYAIIEETSFNYGNGGNYIKKIKEFKEFLNKEDLIEWIKNNNKRFTAIQYENLKIITNVDVEVKPE